MVTKQKKKSLIIVGLGYGDEGKGMFTDYLSRINPDSIVVRFNGGQNAGHTVLLSDGTRSVFSNLGSGTLRNRPTFWSQYCAFYPTTFIQEFADCSKELRIYVDKKCPVTTHYDVLFNRAISSKNNINYSTTGVGFGATVSRHKLGIEFKVLDFRNTETIYSKLKLIRKYYEGRFETELGIAFSGFDHDSEDELFVNYVDAIHELKMNNIFHFSDEEAILRGSDWNTFIFEGAQGILLDQTHGTRPFITKSNTTSKNAIHLIQDNIPNVASEIYYISRAYATRHGVGPFNEQSIDLINTDSETNVDNDYQGRFRIGPLQIDLLNYSLQSDNIYSNGLKKHLVITCIDQITGHVPVNRANEKLLIDPYSLPNLLGQSFKSCFFSRHPCSDHLDQVRNKA